MTNNTPNVPDERGGTSLYLLVMCVMLVGCSKRNAPSVEPPAESDSAIRYRILMDSVGSFSAYEFRLKDGTRCVSTINGITCEWLCNRGISEVEKP
jgi:hypothetical protein